MLHRLRNFTWLDISMEVSKRWLNFHFWDFKCSTRTTEWLTMKCFDGRSRLTRITQPPDRRKLLIWAISRWWPSARGQHGKQGLLLTRVSRQGYRTEACFCFTHKDTCSNTHLKLIGDKHIDLLVSAAVNYVYCCEAAQDLENCSLTGWVELSVDNECHPRGMRRD